MASSAVLSPTQQSEAMFDPEGLGFFGPHYARTINFAREHVEIPRAPPDLSAEDVPNTARFVFGNEGDLIGECVVRLRVLRVGSPPPRQFFDAESFVEAASLRVGGVVVDRQTRAFWRVYDAFHRTRDKKDAYARATHAHLRERGTEGREGTTEGNLEDEEEEEHTLWLPLPFCHCRHPGRSLPLAAIARQAVEIELELAGTEPEGWRLVDVALLADMIYLDAPQREALALPTTYQLEATQTNVFDIPPDATAFAARLRLFGPVKCLYFLVSFGDDRWCDTPAPPRMVWAAGGWQLEEPVSEREAPLKAASLSIEGVPRFPSMPGTWWNHCAQAGFEACPPPGFYAMPLCLAPDSLQPTGATNCSLLSRVDLRVELKRPAPPGTELHVFATGYNFLVVRDGAARLMCGETSAA